MAGLPVFDFVKCTVLPILRNRFSFRICFLGSILESRRYAYSFFKNKRQQKRNSAQERKQERAAHMLLSHSAVRTWGRALILLFRDPFPLGLFLTRCSRERVKGKLQNGEEVQGNRVTSQQYAEASSTLSGNSSRRRRRAPVRESSQTVGEGERGC